MSGQGITKRARIGALVPVHVRAALHELDCRECRVTWKSWAQRLLGIRKGYTP